MDICRANEATTAQLKDMTPGQTIKQEANAVNQKEDEKKPKAPKDSGKGSKNQLSANCKFCDRKHERKGTNALRMAKPVLRVEKRITSQLNV